MTELIKLMEQAYKNADNPEMPRKLIWEAVGLLCETAAYGSKQLKDSERAAQIVILLLKNQ